MKVKQIILLPFLTIILLLPACTSKPNSIEEHLKSAEAYAASEYNAAAAMELKKALSRLPDHVPSLLLLDKVTKGPNKSREVLPFLYRAQQAGVDDTRILYRLAKAYLDLDQFEAAQKEIDSLISTISKPENLVTLEVLRAEALLGQRKYKEAEDTYVKLLQNKNNEVIAKLGLASVSIKKVADQIPHHPSYSNIKLPGDQFLFSSSKQSGSETLSSDMKRLLRKSEKYLDQILETDTDNIGANVALAEILFLHGNYSKAIDYANHSLTIDQQNTKALLVLSRSNIALGYLESAKHGLLQLLAIDKSDLQARNTLSSVYLSQGYLKENEELLEPYLIKGTKNEDLFINLGIAELIKNNISEALKYFKEAVIHFPKSSYAYAQLGTTYLQNEQPRLALDAYKKARKNDKNNFEISLGLIQVILSNGKDSAGLRVAEILETEHPSSPIPYHIQGKIYEFQERYYRSKEMYQRAIEVEPSFYPSRVQLVKLFSKQNEISVAEKLLTEGLIISHGQLDLSIEMASLQDRKGQHINAINRLKTIISDNQNSIEPKVALGKIYLHQGDFREALKIKKTLSNIDPLPANVLLFFTDYYRKIGNATELAKMYSLLEAQFPGHPYYQLSFAQAKAMMGKYKSAEEKYQKVLSMMGEDFIPVLIGIADLELQQNNSEVAQNVIKMIREKSPGIVENYLLKGDLSMLEKNYSDAIKNFIIAFRTTNDPTILKEITSAYLKKNQGKKADKLLTKLKIHFSENMDFTLIYIDFYQKTGDFKKAFSEAERFLKIQPNNALILDKLAQLHLVNDSAEAWFVSKKAYAITPEAPAVLNTYGQLCLNRKQFGESLDVLEKAVIASPSTPSYKYHFARALIKSGQSDPAKRLLQSVLAKNDSFLERDYVEALLSNIGTNKSIFN
ncbi:MAG: XrtA/PEP-CTERM system TPR-repeat protein PrsT [Gammaproteobacteria bacterium]